MDASKTPVFDGLKVLSTEIEKLNPVLGVARRAVAIEGRTPRRPSFWELVTIDGVEISRVFLAKLGSRHTLGELLRSQPPLLSSSHDRKHVHSRVLPHDLANAVRSNEPSTSSEQNSVSLGSASVAD